MCYAEDMTKRAPEQTKQAVRRFVADGWSRAAIARWLGVPRGTVARWCDPSLAARQRPGRDFVCYAEDMTKRAPEQSARSTARETQPC